MDRNREKKSHPIHPRYSVPLEFPPGTNVFQNIYEGFVSPKEEESYARPLLQGVRDENESGKNGSKGECVQGVSTGVPHPSPGLSISV